MWSRNVNNSFFQIRHRFELRIFNSDVAFIVAIADSYKMETVCFDTCHLISLFSMKERKQILSFLVFFKRHFRVLFEYCSVCVVGICQRTEYTVGLHDHDICSKCPPSAIPLLPCHSHFHLCILTNKNLGGIRLGERGGQAIGPPRPIQLSGKFLSTPDLQNGEGHHILLRTYRGTSSSNVEAFLQENRRTALYRDDPVLHTVRLRSHLQFRHQR
jgi:hypothetical protein